MIGFQCGIQKLSGGINNQRDAPVAPPDFSRIPVCPQKAHRDAINAHRSATLVQIADYRLGLMAVKIAVQPPVSRIPFRIVGNVLEARPRLSSDIYDNFVEIFAADMVPECQFANAAKSVYTQLFDV
jgi:hypothetical protein